MSRFDKIFEARTEVVRTAKSGDNNQTTTTMTTTDGEAESGKTGTTPAVKRKSRSAAKAIAARISEPPAELADSEQTKRGRPTAKRSDPNFVGLTTYIRRETHMQAKIALLEDGEGTELSELVETLISDWLSEKRNSAV